MKDDDSTFDKKPCEDVSRKKTQSTPSVICFIVALALPTRNKNL